MFASNVKSYKFYPDNRSEISYSQHLTERNRSQVQIPYNAPNKRYQVVKSEDPNVFSEQVESNYPAVNVSVSFLDRNSEFNGFHFRI
jgi:hypothetical protein